MLVEFMDETRLAQPTADSRELVFRRHPSVELSDLVSNPFGILIPSKLGENLLDRPIAIVCLCNAAVPMIICETPR